MKTLATMTTVNGEATSYTYGNTAGISSVWDADMIYGCHCDSGYYHGPYGGDISDFKGHDCTLLECPHGDDPITDFNGPEAQNVTCDATGGSFSLEFRQSKTVQIPASATAADVKARLEEIPSIGVVTVNFHSESTAACESGSHGFMVIFHTEHGALPNLVPDASSLTGGSGTCVVTKHIAGTTENIECSGRGVCDTATGICNCFKNFGSSNGTGGIGSRADCGAFSMFYP